MAKLLAFLGVWMLSSCAGGGGISGNFQSDSSDPVNPKEVVMYKKAILRCYKTGGSRVVKIHGVLRCF